MPPHHTGALLERDGELAAVDGALDELAAGTGGLIAFAAPAGLGKTTLLAEVRRRAAARGCTVLSARGGDQEQQVAFHVARQLLQPRLAGLTDADLRGTLGAWYGIVGPALGVCTADGPPPDPQGLRDGLDWVLTHLAVNRAPVVLVLDDAHWADPQSLDWLAAFAPRADDLALLLVVAYRPDELPASARAFHGLSGRAGHRPLGLEPLTAEAVGRLVRASLGQHADEEFCRECWAVTAGNPFEAVELTAKIRDRGLRPHGHSAPLLRDLATAVKGPGLISRLERLGPSATRLAWAVAVLGTEARPALAAAVAGLGPEQAADCAARLREARILAAERAERAERPESSEGPERAERPERFEGPERSEPSQRTARFERTGPYERMGRLGHAGSRTERGGGPTEPLEFVHPLIATAVYRAIPDAVRVALHGQAAWTVVDAGLGARAAARHLLETHPEGDPWVVEQLRAAAGEMQRAGAAEAARAHLARALREPPPPEQRAAVLYELGCASQLLEPSTTVNHLRAALAEPIDDPALRDGIVFRLSQCLAHTDRISEAAEVVGEAARTATSARTRLRMQAEQFMWDAFRSDEPDSPSRSRRLSRLADRLTGRDLTERYIIGLRAWDAVLRGEPASVALRHAGRALTGGLPWADENRGFEVPVLVAMAYVYADRPERAEELFATGIADFERQGWRGAHLSFGYLLLGHLRYRSGRLAEAENLARHGVRLADRVGRGTPAQWYSVAVLIQILVARGRIEEATALAAEYAFGAPFPAAVTFPDAQAVYGELLLARGRHRDAAAELAAVGRRLDPRGMRNPAWCPWQLHLALAEAPDAPGRARALAEDALARARQFGAPSTVGMALRVTAEVTGGPQALPLLEEAVTRLESSPATHELARALIAHGAALRAAGAHSAAAPRLLRGLEGARQSGADGLAELARAELALLPRAGRPERTPQAAAPGSP